MERGGDVGVGGRETETRIGGVRERESERERERDSDRRRHPDSTAEGRAVAAAAASSQEKRLAPVAIHTTHHSVPVPHHAPPHTAGPLSPCPCVSRARRLAGPWGKGGAGPQARYAP